MAKLTSVVMPKWGMEMTEGEIVEWHIAVGDSISASADVVDVETAKIVNTVTTSDSGTVVRLCANTGDIVPVGGLLAVLSDGAVSEEEIDAYVAPAGGAAPAPAVEPVSAVAPGFSEEAANIAAKSKAGASEALTEGSDDSAVPASTVARRVAAANNINLNNLTGSGRHGRVSLDDVRRAAAAAGLPLNLPQQREFEATGPADDSHLSATPVARRLARDLGISLHSCKATGRHGRISKADVEAAAARTGKSPAAPSITTPAPMPAPVAAVASERLSGARRTIAAVVSRAKSEVPHFRVNADVDVGAVMALRATLNERRADIKVSLNDVLIKACAMALAESPKLNARFDGETLEHHAQVNIASAVATANGVLMPVLRDAAKLGLGGISEAMRDLATRAKTGRLAAEEMNSATFGISNLGMFGIDSFDAIINQPAVAILAVGAASQRPVVRGGELATGTIMTMSLSSDHRVVDGADAARFLAEVRELLEQPGLMLG